MCRQAASAFSTAAHSILPCCSSPFPRARFSFRIIPSYEFQDWAPTHCEAMRQRGTMQCFAFIRPLTRSTMQSHIRLGGAQVHRHSSVLRRIEDQSRQARYRAFRQRSFPFSVSVRVRGEACLILRCQAAGTASLVQRNSVPSSHMRCSTVARRRATATQARLSPRFLARRRPRP